MVTAIVKICKYNYNTVVEKAHWNKLNRFCDSISLYPTHFVMIWCKLTLFVTSDPRANDKTD